MKVFLISHVADLDGVMPVVLTDLTFEDYDYQLLDIKEVDDYIKDALKTKKLDSYDRIFMTDLSMSEEVAKEIAESSWKDKFTLLDHHKGNLGLNQFPFAHVVVEQNGILTSGTSLYYEYLLTHYANDNIKKNSVSYMVSLTRLVDTWQWQKYGVTDAPSLATLLSFYGNDKFISHYTNFLRKNREFYFSEAEKLLIEMDETRKREYVEEQKEHMIIKEILGYRVGIVFSELYRSYVGNELATYFQDQVDLIMIIQMNRSISFRSVKEDVDVSLFAQHFHGNGHLHAAGAPLPEDIQEYVINYVVSKAVDK